MKVPTTVRHITCMILIVTAVVWGVWDFVPFFTPERGDTISEVILYYSLRCFSLPMMFGVLMGHFFFPIDSLKPKPKILIPIGLSVIVVDLVSYYAPWECLTDVLHKAQEYPGIWFVVGIPVGLLFWSQSKEDKT